MAKSEDAAAGKEQKADETSRAQEKDGGRKAGLKQARRLWYDESNREIIVYYLIAVFCLELIVGAVAFFYGVTNAEPLVAGGPKMARFPWVGWLVAAVLSPVGLLLLLHLSGQFFSRALNGGESAGGSGGGDSDVVPERVQRVYSIVRHAPTIVILLGLLAMGCAILFLDSAMEMALAVGAALKPYILWIIGGVVCFLLFGYLGRLWFLARHKRMEQEYAYRMKVLETTGIVIMNKDCIPMRYENGQLQLLAKQEDGELKALPEKNSSEDDSSRQDEPDKTDVEDATIVSK
ncbi:MAG: hypothetical protein Q4F72_07865 [Desulfovibrionaceae bacterium]|nr:hypothetical protein [Desulfovibrionaceae bacterium]